MTPAWAHIQRSPGTFRSRRMGPSLNFLFFFHETWNFRVKKHATTSDAVSVSNSASFDEIRRHRRYS